MPNAIDQQRELPDLDPAGVVPTDDRDRVGARAIERCRQRTVELDAKSLRGRCGHRASVHAALTATTLADVQIKPLDFDYDFYAFDPGGWASSMANSAELLRDIIGIVEPRSIIEVGAWAGTLSQLLLRWTEPFGGTVTAIDPFPHDALPALVEKEPRLTLISEMSHEGLKQVDEITELVVLDGDHNYYSVLGELEVIADRIGDGDFPAVLLHDTGWPHGRRDTYENPDNIPEGELQPYVRNAGLHPSSDGIVPGSLTMWASAKHEGGPKNGVLTAVEDFVAERPDLRLATVASFFGLGIIWREDAPYAAELEEYLSFWADNPIIARLEANRVLQISTANLQAGIAGEWRQRDQKKAMLIEELLRSSVFRFANRLLGLKNRGKDLPFSEEKLRALLAESRTEPSIGADVR